MTKHIDAIGVFNSHSTQRGVVAECRDYGKCKYDCKLNSECWVESPCCKGMSAVLSS